MRLIFWLLVIASLFSYIMFKSGAWETRKTPVVRDGVEYYTTEHVLHWDKFADYVKAIPGNVKNQVETFLNR